MHLEKLSKKAVRSAKKTMNPKRLDQESLKQVVGGGRLIDTSICEIHFYYPADGVE